MNDLPSLDALVKGYNHWITVWTWCMLGSTFFVAIGLVLEYWEPISDFVEELKRPMAVFRWSKFREIVGGILITVGVAGEFGFTLKVFLLESRLEETNQRIRDVLTKELGTAEDHIRTIGELATSAKSDASTALTDSKAAGTSAGKALAQTKLASDAAAKAQGEIVEVATQTKALTAELSVAEASASAERAAREDLQRSLGARWIIGATTPDGHSNLDILKKYKGHSVLIESISDWEARRAAFNLKGIFHQAGWKIVNPETRINDAAEMLDGVVIDTFSSPLGARGSKRDPSEPEFRQEESSAEAGRDIMLLLRANGWSNVNSLPAGTGDLEPDEIKIVVGFKPTSYFLPDWFQKAVEEQIKRMKQWDKTPSRVPK